MIKINKEKLESFFNEEKSDDLIKYLLDNKNINKIEFYEECDKNKSKAFESFFVEVKGIIKDIEIDELQKIWNILFETNENNEYPKSKDKKIENEI